MSDATTTEHSAFRALVEEKFRARDLALEVAVDAMSKRLDGMNEFREALRDQTQRFLSRLEYNESQTSMARSVEQTRIDLASYVVKLDQFDRSGMTERAQLDKRLDNMNEFRAQLRDQAATFVSREVVTASLAALTADIKRIEINIAGLVSESDFQKMEERTKTIERQQATWDGRLWALGSLFLFLNVGVSWYLSNHH